jgi:hypothetical protein
MPADYDQFIAELNAQEAELLNELETIRAGRTAILRLKANQEIRAALTATPASKFAGFGPKKAVLDVLREAGRPMTTSEIHEAMVAGGWRTESDKPLANVSATLSQMRDREVVKVGEAWRLRSATDLVAEFASTGQTHPLPQ